MSHVAHHPLLASPELKPTYITSLTPVRNRVLAVRAPSLDLTDVVRERFRNAVLPTAPQARTLLTLAYELVRGYNTPGRSLFLEVGWQP